MRRGDITGRGPSGRERKRACRASVGAREVEVDGRAAEVARLGFRRHAENFREKGEAILACSATRPSAAAPSRVRALARRGASSSRSAPRVTSPRCGCRPATRYALQRRRRRVERDARRDRQTRRGRRGPRTPGRRPADRRSRCHLAQGICAGDRMVSSSARRPARRRVDPAGGRPCARSFGSRASAGTPRDATWRSVGRSRHASSAADRPPGRHRAPVCRARHAAGPRRAPGSLLAPDGGGDPALAHAAARR